MQHYFLVSPLTADWQSVAWCECAEGSSPIFAQGTLAVLATTAMQTAVIALLPGHTCSFFEVLLPKGRVAQIKKALPFLLEDQLAEELDQVHLVLPLHSKPGEMNSVLAVSKTWMRVLLSAFKTYDLNLVQAIPDWLCVPFLDNTWSIHLTAEKTWVRQGLCAGFEIPQALLPQVLALALAQSPQKPEEIQIYHATQQREDIAKTLSSLTVPLAYVDVAENPLIFWQKTFVPKSVVNLLQDEFFIKPKADKDKQLWRRAAGLVLAIIAVQLLQPLTYYNQLEKQYNEVNAQTLALYQQVFPEATQTRQAQQQLEQALGTKGTGANKLFDYLMKVSPPLLNATDVELQQLVFQNDSLRLEIITKDFATLSQFGTVLAATGLSVQQVSASLEDKQVKAELAVTGSAPQ